MRPLLVLSLASCGIILLVPQCGFAAVAVNEVAWMGSPPQADQTAAEAANDEWMELANDGGAAVDLTGWRLEAADGSPSITLSGQISAGGFFLLERTDDGTVPGIAADLIYTGALSNSGEALTLRDANGTVVQRVDAASGWPAGDNATKDTMQRSGSSWITATPTPRAANAQSVPPSSAPASPPPSATEGVAPPAPPPAPSLGADAGKDALAIAGAIVHFSGLALGLDGKPLDGARFFWNFGDGSTQEAKSPTHIFHFPGTYHVNLLVSSGHYSGSDWLTVTVLPAELSISEIQPGENGFIEIANASAARVDIGGMFLTDDRRVVFRIPPDTVIGPKDVVVLPAVNTRLAPSTYLDLRDARGVTLDAARLSSTLPTGASWERDGYDFRVQSTPTPGVLSANAGESIATAQATDPPPVPVPSREPVERSPAVRESVLRSPAALAAPSAGASVIGGARITSSVLLLASVLLGIVAAVGIVILKQKLP